MPKTIITTKQGSVVSIEGTQEEVLALVALFQGETLRAGGEQQANGTKPKPKPKSKLTLADLMAELIDAGFFSSPKGLGAVREALEEAGHFYPVTTLSPVLLRLVRKKGLRRLKDKGHWAYVG